MRCGDLTAPAGRGMVPAGFPCQVGHAFPSDPARRSLRRGAVARPHTDKIFALVFPQEVTPLPADQCTAEKIHAPMVLDMLRKIRIIHDLSMDGDVSRSPRRMR